MWVKGAVVLKEIPPVFFFLKYIYCTEKAKIQNQVPGTKKPGSMEHMEANQK